MSWTWPGIITMGILLLACGAGFRRGFIKEVVTTFFVILSIVMVWFINPYVNEFMRENTPVYEKIQKGCDDVTDSWVRDSVQKGENKPKQIMDNLRLPQFIKNDIQKNNTSQVYSYLSAKNFTDYVASYLATSIFNGLSFLISFLLSTILIRGITYALDIVSRLPVINGVNKLAGAAVGGVKCILFIWIAFLVLTVLCSTSAGETALEWIEKDTFLNYLYGKNLLAKMFMSIFYGK